ncbi:glycosyltransferase family 2 protein [Sphaerothrix gracilis]|uniref:glycosyltransferase family 2 protein n=1 Tax=Sphaerothrix gracilis TaxID=3151835 RepID=UPI0031FCEF6C
MPKVSVIIRCYNEAQHVGKLLQGILQQNVQGIEIIVVDSGSTDETVAIASQYPVKLVTIQPEDFSFGRALNLGCQAATGEFITIASAHVYPVYQDWLETLLTPFERSNVALTYGKQRGNETTKYSEKQVFATWFPDISTGVTHQDYPFCNNANAAIRRSLWQQVPYDETLTGLEDLDWAKQIMDLGYRIVYVPEAEVIHVHNETPLRIYNRYRREAIALKQIYPQEKFSFLSFLYLLITNILSDCCHALHDKAFAGAIKSILIFRLMQFWGTYRGYSHHVPVSKQLRQTFYYPRNLSKFSASSKKYSGKVIDYSSKVKN